MNLNEKNNGRKVNNKIIKTLQFKLTNKIFVLKYGRPNELKIKENNRRNRNITTKNHIYKNIPKGG